MKITRRTFLKGALASAASVAAPASALYMVPALPSPLAVEPLIEDPITSTLLMTNSGFEPGDILVIDGRVCRVASVSKKFITVES